MQQYHIAVLPGDGIGPEIVTEALKVLKAIGEKKNINFHFKEAPIGGIAFDQFGTPLPQETLTICQNSDAVLLGAVGGPKWDHLPKELSPEQGGLLTLRKSLDLYANLRPIYTFPALVNRSPIRSDILQNGVDFVIVRELSSGLYFGEPKGRVSEDEAVDTMRYTRIEIDRLAQIGFEIAHKRQKRVTVVDKANVLETGKLWREVVGSMRPKFSDIEVDFMYIDNCAMQLIINPHQFDVIVTENTFGDILSDEAAALTGSIGMLPSASIGTGKVNLYEPIHGTAPDIAGKKIANPIATILSAALMLDYTFGLKAESQLIRNAIGNVLQKGLRTSDIKEESHEFLSTNEMGNAIVQEIYSM
jgi:3-isopropylmalate dehydrogenase